jgi:tetratricopeptide (TPR) repeat protein
MALGQGFALAAIALKLAGKLLKIYLLPHLLDENDGGRFRGMATATLNGSEEAQLLQTIEMFEVIVQSQPNDCQSLEILKEAYTKLGREQEVIDTSKRIAQAYLQMGQLSSAILEYETVLQRRPNDTDVQAALKEIEEKANNVAVQQIAGVEPTALSPASDTSRFRKKMRAVASEVDDGRKAMHKIFVESRVISAGDFDLCWRTPDLAQSPSDVSEPFIHTLSEKALLPVEKSLKLLSDKSRLAYLPLDKYEVDIELTRGFPMASCRRWCVLPFDRMSKAVLVATANPFNQQAAKELGETTTNRLLWYLALPVELIQNIRKAFR